MINRGRFSIFARAETEYSTRTVDIIRRSTVIDMLGLLTLDYGKLRAREADPRRFQQADFLRLKNCGLRRFHPAAGFTTGDIYAESSRDITRWNAFIKAHQPQFLRVDTASDFEHYDSLTHSRTADNRE